MSLDLARAISQLAAAPGDHLDGFVRALQRQPTLSPAASNERLAELLPDTWRPLGRQVIGLARDEEGRVELDHLALGLQAAALARHEASREQEVELVWSGPSHAQSTFRRTDRAWVDLIDDAHTEMWISSFSIGSITRVQEAILAALDRGVLARFLVEREQDSGGALRYNGFERFDQRILAESQFYHWPQEERELDSSGNPGLMHAKAVVIDGEAMFVTSANLSSAALERNIEVGLIVRGGSQPRWLADRFQLLVESATIREIPV